jgi:hypothetical protein
LRHARTTDTIKKMQNTGPTIEIDIVEWLLHFEQSPELPAVYPTLHTEQYAPRCPVLHCAACICVGSPSITVV